MLMTTWGWAALLLAVSACSSGGSVPVQPGTMGLDKTGLEGTARRGPVQPVCREGEVCDAPLQAGFALRQGGHLVVRFASDSAGHFVVYAPPGTYIVGHGASRGPDSPRPDVRHGDPLGAARARA
jgi:hypothetical protein